MSVKYYCIESKKLPVYFTADVVVAGGGSAGFAAALAAARNHAKTIIIEREFALGGIMTSGLMAKVAIERYMTGIPTEVMMNLGKENMAIPPLEIPDIHPVSFMTEVPVDPEASKRILEEMLLEANVTILYGTIVVDVIKENNIIKAVVIENKNGRQVIEGEVFVDATGDGDVSYQAGANYEIGNKEDGLCSAPTLMFRIGNVDLTALLCHLEKTPGDLYKITPAQIREAMFGNPRRYAHIGRFHETIRQVENQFGLSPWEKQVLTVRNGILMMNLPHERQVLVNTTRILHKNAIDAQVITESMIEGRKQSWFIYRFLKQHIPGFEQSFLMDTASILGIRETRRIIGDHMHTVEDFKARRKYKDAILKNTDSVEYHNPKGVGTAMERYNIGEYEEISYRSILVKGFVNLMVIGRCFSADQLA
ncbi:MAG: FAD-dependent oxidoreductase, partial [Sphaerochaetaceae bacterium]|nr:FAD-dependent oxidoreductase [Sphaerochaetaceae bacterium]